MNNPQVNDTRLADLTADVREYGRLAAQGKDSLPMYAVRIVNAAADGVISTEKDANGVDDAERLYTELVKAQSRKAVHEHTAAGLKANISKTRQLIIAASKPTCDFAGDVLPRTQTVRKEVLAKDPKAKVKSAYPAYVDAARAQNDQDDALSDEQLAEVVMKPETTDPTLETIYEAIEKKLEGVISGENKHGLKDDNPLIVEAHGLIRQALAAMLVKTERAEFLAKAAELGLTVV